MGSAFSQAKDLFVNERCVPIDRLFQANQGGLILLLAAFALATFALEALITLAILSCATRQLRLQGIKGFFWRLGGCLCIPRPITDAEMRDLERTQPKGASEPTSTRKSIERMASARRRSESDEAALRSPTRRQMDGAPAMPPPRSGFSRNTRRTEDDRLTVPRKESPMTLASGRRFVDDKDTVFRRTPNTLKSGESSRGRSAAQQYAAEVMGDQPDEDAPTVWQETASPSRSEFPFPRSNSSPSRSARPPPQSSYSSSPGSMWTRRK